MEKEIQGRYNATCLYQCYQYNVNNVLDLSSKYKQPFYKKKNIKFNQFPQAAVSQYNFIYLIV